MPRAQFHTILRRCIVAVPLVFSVLVVSVAGAAGPPQPITVQIQKPTGPGHPGTFSVAGAIADSGSVTTDAFALTAGPSPHTEVPHITQTLHGQAGEITVKMEIQVSGTSDPAIAIEDGNWQVVSGTGAYATLHGAGDESAVVDENAGQNTRTLEGTSHL